MMAATIPDELTAILPAPPGVNSIWRTGRRRDGVSIRVYKTPRARAWDEQAILLLRAAGWRPLPPGLYWVALCCTVFTCRLDIDAPLKALLDVVASALGVDDACIGALSAVKMPATARADQRLELQVRIYQVEDKAEWEAHSRRAKLLAVVEEQTERPARLMAAVHQTAP